MKKLLFTLAALIAFGFAASADETHSIDLRLVGPSNYDAAKQEISIAPSGAQSARRATFNFSADIVGSISGVQIGYTITDPEGNVMDPEGPVHIRAVGGLYFRKLNNGPSALPENSYANNYHAETGQYRLIGANLTYGVVWITEPDLVEYFGEDYEDEMGIMPEMYTYPANVIQFQIEVDPSWDGEYVNVTCARDYFKFAWVDGFNDKPYDNFDEYSFKVLNPDFAPATQDFTGEIIFGELDENGNVAISYNGPEEVTFTVTVDGVEVEMTDGMINLGTYGEHTVEVTISAEGYNSVSRMKIFTWEEPVVEVTAAPVINVTTTDDAVIVEAVGDGEVILYCDGLEVPNPMTIERGDQDATFVFTATAQEEGKEISETTTLTVDVPAKEIIEPIYTDEPEVNFDPETLTLTVEGEGEIHVYVNGEEVEVPYTFEPGDEEVTYTVVVTAQEEGKEMVTVTTEVTVPAKEFKVYDIPMPVLNIVEGEDAYTFTATAGEGTIEGVVITLHVTTYDADGVPTTNEYTDPAEVVIERTDADQFVGVWATATLDAAPEGYDDWTNNTTAAQQIVVPAKEEPQPQVTPTPSIVVTPDADNQGYTIEAVGEGDVHLYINGEEVDNPYHIDRTDENIELDVVATAEVAGMEMSQAEQIVVIPAFEGEGYFIVLIDQDGVEHTYPLHQSANNPNNYVNMFTLEFNPWGAFDYDHGEPRPDVPFYFIVNGVRLGAVEEYQAAAMGELDQTLQNPLFANNNFYTVPVGYTYTIGIQILPETGDMYVLVAQGGRVGVDEVLAGKEVSSVRYFNLAGQEMQEANGICIAVTTYTDGTTSTVKVMK